MKTLLAFVAAVAIVGTIILASVGALGLRNTEREVQITIDKDEVKAATEQAVDKTKHLGERATETTREILSTLQADDDAPPSDPEKNPQRPDSPAEPSEDHEEKSENDQVMEV
jgi:hypothetical protein